MNRIRSSLVMLRKHAPFTVRVNLGRLKAKLSPHNVWQNAYFQATYDWLQESQWWSRAQFEAYQLEQLQALVWHAYENVPYYRRIFDARKLKPRDIATLEDLAKIPILTKEDIRAHAAELLARNMKGARLKRDTTEGSTGEPLGLYHEHPTSQLREWAFYYRQWGWAGYRFGDRYVTLARHTIRTLHRDGTPALWDYRTDFNELTLASTEMHDANMRKFISLIRKFRPRFMYIYPSSAEILARYLQRHQIPDIKLDAVFSDSETLYPRTRELIESQLGCRIFDHYGLTERVVDAVECEQHDGFHVNMEYGIQELVDEDGQPIDEPGVLGTVVGTGLANYAMPLLRYFTSDLASYAAGPCACGRDTTRIARFQGRVGDYVVSKTGRLVPVLLMVDGHTPVWSKIREIRLRQEREGELTAMVVIVPASDEQEVTSELREELYRILDSGQFDVRIELVDRIPRTGSRGKWQLLEQKLSLRFADVRQSSSEETSILHPTGD
jgi:phenylacetate-CoA ligase